MNRATPILPSALVAVLRLAGAGLLAAMAGIHLHLWGLGYRGIPWIGPLFLAAVVTGFLLAAAVLATPARWLAGVAVLGALLQAGTLGALVLSTTVGLFGFVESTRALLFWPSVWVEAAGAAVLLALATVGHGRPLRARTPGAVGRGR